jgi:2-iminobutanoate/2-iminopropanoate deaminase
MKQINAQNAPQVIGPYSHAVKTGTLLYCSGQTPINPVTMKIEAKTFEEETIRVIENLRLVLQEEGLELENIIKVNVFLTDMEMFPEMNAVYAQYFGIHKPARTTVAVKGLPMNARIEIECIAEYNN